MTNYFNEYSHSKAIIFSHLEGQYPHELLKKEQYQILFTTFDYHYVSGQIPSDTKDFISEIIAYIKNHDVNEFVLFGPSIEWNTFLQEAMSEIGGVTDARYSYQLDQDQWSVNNLSDEIVLEEKKEGPSNTLLLQANLYKNQEVVSTAKALMTGANHVELDVFTSEDHRTKGYAYQVSQKLIDALLQKGLVPEWNCWRMKESSQHLAKKLGFKFSKEIPAFIWVDEIKPKSEL